MKENKKGVEEYLAPHYINRSNWLRAAVLGANDGILSTASLAIGVAAATDVREPIILATLAGLVAGALSMTVGEFVSVSSQKDIETADIAREKKELEEMPELELQRLVEIYEERGLKKETALQVAIEFTEKDALGAHIRDELGLHEMTTANPVQTAFAAGSSFVIGASLPLLVTMFLPLKNIEYILYGSAIGFLILLGAVAAKLGGSNIGKAIMRITFWGSLAMVLSATVGYIFGINS